MRLLYTMTMRRFLYAFVTALLLTGCASALPILDGLARGSSYLGTLLDVARGGADAFLARHPNLETERRIGAAEHRARLALAALERTLSAAESASAGEVDRARAEAVAAYGELRQLLDELGVLSARPPDGGAETDAPVPAPLDLPTAEDVAARLVSP